MFGDLEVDDNNRHTPFQFGDGSYVGCAGSRLAKQLWKKAYPS